MEAIAGPLPARRRHLAGTVSPLAIEFRHPDRHPVSGEHSSHSLELAVVKRTLELTARPDAGSLWAVRRAARAQAVQHSVTRQ